jgi:hypothetical protein
VHLILAFAAPRSDAGRAALARLALPQLERWLADAAPVARDIGEETSAHAPHERVFARALGWPVDGDAPLPWAARLAARDGIATGSAAWGLVTPVHWRVGADAVHLADPRTLDLSAADSRTLFDAVQPLFDGDGLTLAWGAPLHWYASHPGLATLATASLDRVVGRNVDRWLPAQPEARGLRRLQSEVQMRLHAHPLNEAREAEGRLAVNSFWLSGCGIAQPEAPAHAARLDERLSVPALAEDWPGWSEAFAAFDAALPALNPTRLTLCGERGALSFAPRQRNVWQRIAAQLPSARRAPHAWAEGL